MVIPAKEFKKMSTSDILGTIDVAIRVLREKEKGFSDSQGYSSLLG